MKIEQASPYAECSGCDIDTHNWRMLTYRNDGQQTPVVCPVVKDKRRGSAFVYKGRLFSLIDFARHNGLSHTQLAQVLVRFHRDFRAGSSNAKAPD